MNDHLAPLNSLIKRPLLLHLLLQQNRLDPPLVLLPEGLVPRVGLFLRAKRETDAVSEGEKVEGDGAAEETARAGHAGGYSVLVVAVSVVVVVRVGSHRVKVKWRKERETSSAERKWRSLQSYLGAKSRMERSKTATATLARKMTLFALHQGKQERGRGKRLSLQGSRILQSVIRNLTCLSVKAGMDARWRGEKKGAMD